MFSLRQVLEGCGFDGEPPPRSEERLLERVIRQHVEAILFETHGNQQLAATILGISRHQLRWKLNRWAKEDGTDGARCLHCGWHRIVKIEGPDGYYKCLRCRSGFSNP